MYFICKKLIGASANGLGSLFVVARNFTFSNIQNIYYKSNDANEFNDVSISLSSGTINNYGKMKTQANEIDLEANTVYIGKDIASDVYVRGDLYCERLFSADGQIDMSNAILAQF